MLACRKLSVMFPATGGTVGVGVGVGVDPGGGMGVGVGVGVGVGPGVARTLIVRCGGLGSESPRESVAVNVTV